MYTMLPEKYNPAYPLSQDFRSQWKAELGDLKLYRGDYAGSVADFTLALSTPPIQNPKMFTQQLAGHQQAAFGLAWAYALTGDLHGSLKWLGEAPSMYWSGCGNCAEGEAAMVYRYRTVWTAANLPPAQAETKLLAIIDGHYVSMKSRLNHDENWQISNARVDAAFFLGELYRQQGKRTLAVSCYDLVIHADAGDPIDRIAETRRTELR